MDSVLGAFRVFFGGLFSLLESWPPIVSLALISLLVGIAMLWVFRRVSNQEAILQTKKRLTAHLYELRLFADEPRLIWRAQKGLLLGNLRYLGLMTVPAIILTVPIILLLVQLEAFYGQEPLAVGKPAIVTVRMKGAIDVRAPSPELEAPTGIAVETPTVRVLSERQFSWRIRPLREVSENLRVVFPNTVFEKSVDSGHGPRYLSVRRAGSLLDRLLYPAERRISEGAIEWIEVRYPAAEVWLWGLGFHWLVWFIVISLASAWLLRKRFGVTL